LRKCSEISRLATYMAAVSFVKPEGWPMAANRWESLVMACSAAPTSPMGLRAGRVAAAARASISEREYMGRDPGTLRTDSRPSLTRDSNATLPTQRMSIAIARLIQGWLVVRQS
jgi:hypothetical protein